MREPFWANLLGRALSLTTSLLLLTIILTSCQASLAPAAETARPPAASEATAMLPATGATPTVAAPSAAPTMAAPTAAPTLPAPAAAGAPSIHLATDPKLGQILVGDKGMTLYMFLKDAPNQSNCNAECLKKWPPLLAAGGQPSLGPGLDAALVGTAPLADGSSIVTYNRMPLYYWYKDVQPGDTTGEGVGEVWYVVSPDGQYVEEDGSQGTPFSQMPAQPAAATAPVMETPAAPAAQGPSITVFDDPKLGQILVGDKGMTLYMFKRDAANKSNCNGDCLVKWPPLLVAAGASPVLGPGVDASLVGTATLADGAAIVTYNQMPLYYWYKDVRPGDVTGQGVGDVWYVVSPAGAVITQAQAVQPTPVYQTDKQDKDGPDY